MLRHLDILPAPREFAITPVNGRKASGADSRRRCGFIDEVERLDVDPGAGETTIDTAHARHRFQRNLDAKRPSGRIDPWRWRDSLTTDYWNPPTTASQFARQRVLAVILGFALAVLLAQLGL